MKAQIMTGGILIIKIAVKDETNDFAKRLNNMMCVKYPNEFRVLYFPTIKKAQTAVKKLDFNVLLLNDPNELSSNTIPKQCRVALLTENRVEAVNDSLTTVCKYQSAEEWYTYLLEICRNGVNVKKGGYDTHSFQKSHVCIFTSGGGGVGASAAAAAFCTYCAQQSKTVIYINFETLLNRKMFCESYKKANIIDMIMSIKNGRDDTLKLVENAIIKDSSGVNYISSPREGSALFSVSGEDIVNVCEYIRKLEKYEFIVLDINFDSSERIVLPFINSDIAVFVSDGTRRANEKCESAISLLPRITGLNTEEVLEKIRVLYNKFDLNDGEIINNQVLGKLGGINYLSFSNEDMLISAISKLPPFEKLVECLNV